MSFLRDLVDTFTNREEPQNEGPPGYYPQQNQYSQPYSSSGPPQAPYPWVAEWDTRDSRWIYINRETGERSDQFPSQQNSAGNESHAGRNAALGAAAGLVGGAALMYEGEKVEDKWREDKYQFEDKLSNGVQDLENAPEDAARWTGEKVGEVENIPDKIETKWDDAVDDVEQVPDDVAGWAGRRVGDVERFGDDIEQVPEDVADWTGRRVGDVERFGDDVEQYGDNLEDNFDQGRNDTRYDD